MKNKLLTELLAELHRSPELRSALLHDYKGTIDRYGLTPAARKVMKAGKGQAAALKNHLLMEKNMTLGGQYHPMWPGYNLKITSISPSRTKQGVPTLLKIEGEGFIVDHTTVVLRSGRKSAPLNINNISSDGTSLTGTATIAKTGEYIAVVVVNVDGKTLTARSVKTITVS